MSDPNRTLIKALRRIEEWFNEFPMSGKYFDGKELTYGSAFGSNGERDYMRTIAKNALVQYEKQLNSQNNQKNEEMDEILNIWCQYTGKYISKDVFLDQICEIIEDYMINSTPNQTLDK